ncbi:hypothetical protein BH09PAT4_BH09PAT4_03060 [soil metagenome]
MTKHKPLLLSLVTLLLLVGVVAVLEITDTTHLLHPESSPTTKTADQAIDYSPATDEEKADSDSLKTDSSNQQDQNTNNSGSTTKKQVEVTLTGYRTDTSNLYVNGYVSGIVEDGGTCTTTLKNGSAVVTRSRQGVSNATNTTCGQTTIPLSSLHSGTWQATLNYSSTTSTGKSSVMDVVVE